MKRFISYFFICCCSLLFSPNIAITQQDKLEIKLDISKNIFLKSEPILANIFVINRTNEMIYVKRLILVYDYFEILVTDATGKVFPCAYGRDMDPNVPHDTVSLGPNKSISQIIDLLPMYANGKRNLRNVHTRTYFEPGSYTVQAIYEINHTRFYSTIIPITILEPTGIELEAYNLINEATNLELKQNKSQATIVLDTMIQRYPKSSYIVLAYMQKFQMYEYSENEVEQRSGYSAALSLIDKFPNSEAADLALTYILVRASKILTTPDMRKNLLQTISIKHPDTKIGHRALSAFKKYNEK